jgi:hypothetical protein
MLYKFKSKNAGDVIMLEANGRHILQTIGKDPAAKGIIEVAQMDAAIEALKTAITLEESADPKDVDAVHQEGLGLRQRSLPFIDMLQRNMAAGSDVVWGA